MRATSALLALLVLLAGAATAVVTWPPPDGTPAEFTATSWGFVRNDYVPPPAGTHAIFFMEGYMGASTPANGLDFQDPVAPHPTHPTHYVRMPDGVLIGVTVHHEFSGLLAGSGFALVMASVRGTGCSGGTFDLFDQTHREDGARVIDWIGTQPGFEKEVAMFGASYSGITALLVASERPANLRALSANMVIGDMYRDIAYPGGVPNIAFPGLWTLGFRPAQDYLGTIGGLWQLDAICARNAAAHNAYYPTDHAGFGMYSRRVDDTMYRARSPVEFAASINVPTVVGQSFQDEQTGPRGGYTVWPELAPPARDDPCTTTADSHTPRRLVLTNGVHGTSTDNGLYLALPWFKLWLKGDASGYGPGLGYCDFFDREVLTIWEKAGKFVHPNASGPAAYNHTGGAVAFSKHDAFPVPGTDWQEWTLCPDGTVTRACAADGVRGYLSGSQRAGSWNYGSGGRAREGSHFTAPVAPDLLRYRSAALADNLTILGPLLLHLSASTSGTDAEFYVTVADVAPDGDVTYLQKGMLKASHRTIDPARSWYEDGRLIRVSHTHTTETFTNLVTPGAVVEYEVDVYPVGHTFRKGHAIQVQIHSPPLNDGRWGHGPLSPPAWNVVHGAVLQLPVVATVDVGAYPGCGVPDGYRCIPAAHHAGIPWTP